MRVEKMSKKFWTGSCASPWPWVGVLPLMLTSHITKGPPSLPGWVFLSVKCEAAEPGIKGIIPWIK